jgi:hypothetical protein
MRVNSDCIQRRGAEDAEEYGRGEAISRWAVRIRYS